MCQNWKVLQLEPRIRVSFAYIFNIEVDDTLFLVSSSKKPYTYQPVGGAYQMAPSMVQAVDKRFGFYPASDRGADVSVIHDQIAAELGRDVSVAYLPRHLLPTYDYADLKGDLLDIRLFLPNNDLGNFLILFSMGDFGDSFARLSCGVTTNTLMNQAFSQLDALSFHRMVANSFEHFASQLDLDDNEFMPFAMSGLFSGLSEKEAMADVKYYSDDRNSKRECMLDLRREFAEEFTTADFLPEDKRELFADLSYSFRGRTFNPSFNKKWDCMSLQLTDIFVLKPTEAQLEVLRELKERAPFTKDYVFVTPDQLCSLALPNTNYEPSIYELCKESYEEDYVFDYAIGEEDQREACLEECSFFKEHDVTIADHSLLLIDPDCVHAPLHLGRMLSKVINTPKARVVSAPQPKPKPKAKKKPQHTFKPRKRKAAAY